MSEETHTSERGRQNAKIAKVVVVVTVVLCAVLTHLGLAWAIQK